MKKDVKQKVQKKPREKERPQEDLSSDQASAAAQTISAISKIEISEKQTSSKSVTQAQVNIGTIGHVDSGKTTLVQALTGKWADTHSEEVKRGITIKLGYADVTFYKFADGSYSLKEKNEKGEAGTPSRKVSFVDAPGHETLMATVIAAS